MKIKDSILLVLKKNKGLTEQQIRRKIIKNNIHNNLTKLIKYNIIKRKIVMSDESRKGIYAYSLI